MKHLVLVIMILSLSSCKTPCDSSASPVSQLANGVITSWDCKNPTAVKRDMYAWFSEKGLCEAPKGMTGPIASILCPIADTFYTLPQRRLLVLSLQTSQNKYT